MIFGIDGNSTGPEPLSRVVAAAEKTGLDWFNSPVDICERVSEHMMCWLGSDRVKAEMSPEGHGDEADTTVMDEAKK
jgi:hypothetical protein